MPHSRVLMLPLSLALCLLPLSQGQAAGFGIYDARAMAMGGAGTGVGDTHTGFFYNPALPALGEENENRARTSRWYLPMLSVQTTQASLDALDISDADLDTRLTGAIDAFNQATGRDTASNACHHQRGRRRHRQTHRSQP